MVKTKKIFLQPAGKWFYIGLEKSKSTTCVNADCDGHNLIWADGSTFEHSGVSISATSAEYRGFRTKDSDGIFDVDGNTDSSVLCSVNCHAGKSPHVSFQIGQSMYWEIQRLGGIREKRRESKEQIY